jgi:hypothetical protein
MTDYSHESFHIYTLDCVNHLSFDLPISSARLRAHLREDTSGFIAVKPKRVELFEVLSRSVGTCRFEFR